LRQAIAPRRSARWRSELRVPLVALVVAGACLIAPAARAAAPESAPADARTSVVRCFVRTQQRSARPRAHAACRGRVFARRRGLNRPSHHAPRTVRSHRSHARRALAPRASIAAPTRRAQLLAQARAASIARVLATPCANTEITPDASDLPLVREAVLCLINRKRAEAGEQPLVISPKLEAAAESHATELVQDDYFAHVSPSGETPVQRMRDEGYMPSPEDGYIVGENLAWGTYQLSTPAAIAAAWFASPPHLGNILEAQYRETGIGVSAAVPPSLAPGAPGATYAQEFGVILG